jgi:hypothetical protein
MTKGLLIWLWYYSMFVMFVLVLRFGYRVIGYGYEIGLSEEEVRNGI